MRRFHPNVGVRSRHLVLRFEEYGHIEGLTRAGDLYIDQTVALGARVLVDTLKAADPPPSEVDVIYCATVAGLAVPTFEARIASLIGLRPEVKRVPLRRRNVRICSGQ